MPIERIVITGDVLRTSAGEPNQLTNVQWLHEELGPVLHALTGLSPEIGYRRNAEDGGLALAGDWYGLLGHTPSVQAWAATYEMAAPPAFIEALAPDYERALVVGFELSPLLRSALDNLGAPWVDVEIAPIRFLDDLALSVRCSFPVGGPSEARVSRAGARPHPGLVSSDQVEKAVACERARHRHDEAAAACSGACIFLAQTRHDRTLIRKGGFFPDEEAVEGVSGMLDGRRLIIKPHPLLPDSPLIAGLKRQFAASVTEANVYALLAAASDVRFVTISSSAAVEARHFGRDARMLHLEAHADPAPFTSLWAHRSAAFWRCLLGPLLPLNAGATYEAGLVPDRLRGRIGAWGFTRAAARAEASGIAIAPEEEHAATADSAGGGVTG